MLKLSVVLILALLSISLIESKLPSDVEKCSPSDKICILKNINHILQTKWNGSSEFGLIGLKPLNVGDLVIRQNENNPISINLEVTNMKLYGIEETKATKVRGFGPKPDGVHEIILKAPKAIILGDYKMNGKLMILPVAGEGRSNITLIEPITKLTFVGKSLTKDGQVYLDVVSSHLETLSKRFYCQFDNLFNGDKALGDQFNTFINQEWEMLDNEFHKPIVDSFQLSAQNAIKGVFSTTPYNEIFKISE